MDYNKNYYNNAIRSHHRTLSDLAKEQGVEVATIKRRIKKLYQRQGWAERLIAIAAENEHNAQRNKNANSSQKAEMLEKAPKAKKIPALVDTCTLLNQPECLNSDVYEFFVPEFCLNETNTIIRNEKRQDPCAYELHQRIIEATPMKVIYETDLPNLNVYVRDVKKRNIMFAKYFLRLKEKHPDAVYLSCSREVKQIVQLQ